MAALHANSHIFLLPAARIHIVSLLQAMSYGLAVVGSDGWGMEEYLHHERNGLVVKGRYGKVSWADDQAGCCAKTTSRWPSPTRPWFKASWTRCRALLRIGVYARLGREARKDVETKYTVEGWNQNLKSVFDQALGGVPLAASDNLLVADLPMSAVSGRSSGVSAGGPKKAQG